MSQNRNERTRSWLELAICKILGIPTTPPGEVDNKQKNDTAFKSTINVRNVSNSCIMDIDDGTVSIGNISNSRVGDISGGSDNVGVYIDNIVNSCLGDISGGSETARSKPDLESVDSDNVCPSPLAKGPEKGKVFPKTVADISIDASVGKVDLQTSDAADSIYVEANNPENWSIVQTGGGLVIRQYGGGSSISMSNRSVIVGGNGSCISNVSSSSSSMSVNGHRIDVSGNKVIVDGREFDLKAFPKTGFGLGISMVNNKVIVNGHVIDVNNLPSSTHNADGKPIKKQEPDTLKIVIPRSYKGDVDITLSGNDCKMTAQSLQVGELTLDVSMSADLSMNKVTAKSCSLKTSMSGSLSIAEVKVEECKIRTSMSGAVTIDECMCNKADIKSEMSSSVRIKRGSANNVKLRGSMSAVVSVPKAFRMGDKFDPKMEMGAVLKFSD